MLEHWQRPYFLKWNGSLDTPAECLLKFSGETVLLCPAYFPQLWIGLCFQEHINHPACLQVLYGFRALDYRHPEAERCF